MFTISHHISVSSMDVPSIRTNIIQGDSRFSFESVNDYRWWAVSRRRWLEQRKSASQSFGGSSTTHRKTFPSVASKFPSWWTSFASTEEVSMQDVPAGKFDQSTCLRQRHIFSFRYLYMYTLNLYLLYLYSCRVYATVLIRETCSLSTRFV